VGSNELPRKSNWISGAVPRTAQRGVVRLFCFPYAGGSASLFRSWATDLSPTIEVCPVQLPGREDRWHEPALTDLSTLVTTLASALDTFLEPPFAFFGHSMGAFIAFEVTRRLRHDHRRLPALLIVSGARAPQIPDPEPPAHRLPADELLNEMQRLGGIPHELLNHPELIALLLPTLRADLSLCETYAYAAEPPLNCPLVVYGGQQDSKAPPEHLTPWQQQTTAAFQLRMFPGNHFFFVREARTLVMQAVREDVDCCRKAPAAGISMAPRPPIERLIADVWGEVLRVPKVGLDDNFFELGGNSLLMIQAYGKLRQATSTTLSVLDLFRYPTIRLLAKAMEPTRIGPAGFGAIGRPSGN
jgi:medium-chain acyl-[acyl-carrier-protein] hydrolase